MDKFLLKNKASKWTTQLIFWVVQGLAAVAIIWSGFGVSPGDRL